MPIVVIGERLKDCQHLWSRLSSLWCLNYLRYELNHSFFDLLMVSILNRQFVYLLLQSFHVVTSFRELSPQGHNLAYIFINLVLCLIFGLVQCNYFFLALFEVFHSDLKIIVYRFFLLGQCKVLLADRVVACLHILQLFCFNLSTGFKFLI